MTKIIKLLDNDYLRYKMYLSKGLVKFLLVVFVLTQFWGLSLLFPKKLDSANLTNVTDSLSNNRLSFRGELENAHAAATAVINLDSTPEDARNTSSGSAALMGNESIQVGAGNTANTVKTIVSSTQVVLSAGITNAVSDAGMVVATSSAVHTVTFTPVSAVASGAFRVLIPCSTQANNDGYPDKDGFDFSTTAPTVSCLGGGSNISFTGVSGTASASAVQQSSTWYHSFECRYNGTGATPAAVTMYIGTPSGGKLINPAPASTTGPTHYPGQADSYTFRVRQSYGTAQSYANVDETLGTIGVVEAVRVTATVAPILTFQITGIGVAATDPSTCGITYGNRAAATTYNAADFGTVSTTAFKDIAQRLTVSTNAVSGYVVTASESAALTALNVAGTPTIANTTCDSACTSSTATEWNTTTNKGFGYALQDGNGTPVTDVSATIVYNYSSRTFNARSFGTAGVNIMTSTGVVDSDQAYVCYRVVVSGTQQAGDYENYVVYIATATF